MIVYGNRTASGVATFDIWPGVPSLSPLYRHISWGEAFLIVQGETCNVPETESILRDALASYDAEVAS